MYYMVIAMLGRVESTVKFVVVFGGPIRTAAGAVIMFGWWIDIHQQEDQHIESGQSEGGSGVEMHVVRNHLQVS